ncbi:hypothetical protein NC653_018059 [Populus alba x Populus x berolinensis]|uniref:Uncharacterized protein n=1 Tax=Populus alba x Populus x berolinensis TaxID=444605 RepID=A0AAD6QS51_9ROSI|nr:hypothetical protein NC653_018059 [Populus alba x Populus x berolinensis]
MHWTRDRETEPREIGRKPEKSNLEHRRLKQKEQRRKAAGARTRESLGPTNPQHQDPYHHSLHPEKWNSKAETKSFFLPKHNLKRGKKRKQRGKQAKEKKQSKRRQRRPSNAA